MPKSQLYLNPTAVGQHRPAKANARDLQLQTLKQASWSNVNTFLKHYCRNIIPEQKVNKLQQVFTYTTKINISFYLYTNLYTRRTT